MAMLAAGLGIYLLSFEPGPALSFRTAIGSEEVWVVATDAPASLSPLISSAAPERVFGGNGFGVFVLLRICCTMPQQNPLVMPGCYETYV